MLPKSRGSKLFYWLSDSVLAHSRRQPATERWRYVYVVLWRVKRRKKGYFALFSEQDNDFASRHNHQNKCRKREHRETQSDDVHGALDQCVGYPKQDIGPG